MPPSLAVVHRLFTAACELPPAARDSFLDRECGGDAELRLAVDALLTNDANDAMFAESRLDAMRQRVIGSAMTMPKRLGEFEILEVLGGGGMGVVYRGRQQHPKREVAIKVLAPGSGGAEARARFGLEAAALARLQHHGIAQIYAAGSWQSELGEQPFLAMELVRGEPLQQWAARAHPSMQHVLAVLLQVGDALHHAHQRGLIHRDLKPGNVLIDAEGHTKVLDFGIARLIDADREATLRTHTGQVLGTLAYMSPEQANGEADVDVRADVYAAGVLGYQLLTSELPIPVAAGSLTVGLRQLVEQEPRPLGAHGRRFDVDLQTIFGKALRKEPAQRYASMQAFTDDLRRYLAHEPIAARPATLRYLTTRFARRHRAAVVGATIAVLAMIAGTTAAVTWALRADVAATRAQIAEGEARTSEHKALAAERTATAAAADARAAEATARQEARLAESVTAFVEDLFSEAAPEIAQGRQMTVKELVTRGVTSVQAGLADQPLLRARLSRLLGTLLTELGDHKAAVPLAEEALAAFAGKLADDDPLLLDAMLTVAHGRYAAGDFVDAERRFRDLLARHEAAGRSADDRFARYHEGLGACASSRGDFEAALSHYTTMQQARSNHPDVDVRGLDLMRLGVVHNQRREAELADERFQQAYELLRNGDNQLAAAQLASNLGILRLRQDRADEAEELFQEALAIGERVLGPEHPVQMRRLCNLAGLYSQQGRLEESEPLLMRALAIADRSGTGQTDVVANVLTNLGNVKLQKNDLTGALATYERAAAIYEQKFGPQSRELVDVLENMARTQDQLGATAAAEALRKRIAAIRGR